MRFIRFILFILFFLLGQLYGQEKVKDRTQKLIENIKARFAEIDKKKTGCNKYQIMLNKERKHKCNYQK